MTDQYPDAESSFLARARYPKGKKTLQVILDATYDVIISDGVTAASLETIANRANVTQSAVRHYFPTKNELLVAFFTTGTERIHQQFISKFNQNDLDPRTMLFEIVSIHFERMTEVKDIYYYEAAAFLARNPENDIRINWYQTLNDSYFDIISKIKPEWNSDRCKDTAFQVLTLVLGSWITLGSSLSFHKKRPSSELKNALFKGIERLID